MENSENDVGEVVIVLRENHFFKRGFPAIPISFRNIRNNICKKLCGVVLYSSVVCFFRATYGKINMSAHAAILRMYKCKRN